LSSCKNEQAQDLSNFYSLPEIKKDNKGLLTNNKIYPVRVGGKYAFININGDIISPPKFDSIGGYQYTNNFYFVSNKENDVYTYYAIFADGEILDITLDGELAQNQAHYFLNNGEYQFISYDDEVFVFLDINNKKLFEIPNNIIKLSPDRYLSINECNESSFFVTEDGNDSPRVNYFIDYSGNIIKSFSNQALTKFLSETESPVYAALPFLEVDGIFTLYDDDLNKLYESDFLVSRVCGISENLIVLTYAPPGEDILNGERVIHVLDRSFNEISSFSTTYELSELLDDKYILFYSYQDQNGEMESAQIVYDIYGNEIIRKNDAYLHNLGTEESRYYYFLNNFDPNKTEIFDKDFNYVKTLDFFEDGMSMNLLTDEYAIVAMEDYTKSAIIDIQNSSKGNLKYIINPTPQCNIYQNLTDDENKLIVEIHGTGQNVFDVSENKYIFDSFFSRLNYIGDGLYMVETSYFTGVLNESGNFIFAEKSKGVNDEEPSPISLNPIYL
jgi:hypothetical protein